MPAPGWKTTCASTVTVCGTGTVAPIDVTLPVPSADYLERYEGMLIRVPQVMTVTEHFQLGRFNQELAQIQIEVGQTLLKAEASDMDEADLYRFHTRLVDRISVLQTTLAGFGDDAKAEAMLNEALTINPTGIDPNYFQADFLYRNGRYDEASAALNKALKAAPRPGREVADAGRRSDISALQQKIAAEQD